ncbi:hypothetical protein [Nitrosomonas oligotropha]|uniref:Uncharacterized protein n=1 Tax=Nitrosomonas oligotropha TaxID=42354 RepID=A0A1H8JPR4_9PROT|nr:hypothetical protein [Nitrosomonas oligotropha]SDW01962.1 hypothetical protein SAMN05216300_10142 [Nitrosomonas oligotropha]SEN82178.1 hypothetical protein SAMN05216333_101257 [Nitrosomonas oligotropha]
MHATIPALPGGIHYILKSGIELGEADGTLSGLLNRMEGTMLAAGMAVMIKLGFGFLINPGLSESQAKKAQHFFENNFVIKDPNVAGGIRYYQGKILIRTRKPQDDMNVLIKFCPDPEALYIQTPFGRQLNPAAIVTTEALSETEADRIERDPNEVDLMIRFKDTQAILGLAGRPNVDVAQLLIENLVQITGNFGHMFKFGAIGMNVQMAMKDFL